MTGRVLGSLSVGVALHLKWEKKLLTDDSSSCAICLILYKYNAALNEIFFYGSS